MFEHRALGSLDDFFLEYRQRREQGIYFYRINGYNDHIREFLERYFEEARRAGVVIEGRIPNPDERNLAYYEEIMGMQFQLSMGFLLSSLQKWLPRMKDSQRKNVAESLLCASSGRNSTVTSGLSCRDNFTMLFKSGHTQPSLFISVLCLPFPPLTIPFPVIH